MQVILRKEARNQGLSHYFTGIACVRGHICERSVKSKKCVQCNRDRVRKWQRENPDKIAQQRDRNRESINQSCRRSRQKKLEKYRLKHAEWVAQNPEKAASSARASRAKKPEKYRALHREWSAKNKDKVAANAKIQQARRRAATGKFSKQDVASIMAAQRNKCAYFKVCGIGFRSKDQYHIDHILAVSKGGTSDPSNIQILCPDCNRRKGAKDAVAFMQASGFLL